MTKKTIAAILLLLVIFEAPNIINALFKPFPLDPKAKPGQSQSPRLKKDEKLYVNNVTLAMSKGEIAPILGKPEYEREDFPSFMICKGGI